MGAGNHRKNHKGVYKMKKTLKAAAALSILATPALAANMENPLYLPTAGEFYSKTSAGIMYKKADGTEANNEKNHAGAIEFPVWRFQEDLGYGITDRLELHGSFGYTKDGDIDRKGMHQGRIGLTYRILDDMSPVVWDVYADAHLGGVSPMKGSYTATGFNYDNYSNGRWGFYAGTKLGKTWGKFTGAVFAEVLQTFGNHNNEIAVGIPLYVSMGMPSDISVDLKSTTEYNAGVKGFYQLNDDWSFGGGFTYKHHADNGVRGLNTQIPATANPALGAVVVPGLLKLLENMDDGFDEYILSASVARQLTDATQVAVYGEYTFDTAHPQSQNGTDVKAEVGVRLNVRF
jgi:opacity protein-like surface antigen